MFDENYSKPFHIGSPSVFLDLDSLVYIVISLIVIWLVVRLIQKKKSNAKSGFVKFASKYMILCAMPVFLIYLIQLIVAGKMVVTNWIICFLPLVYGAILQLIFFGVGKIKANPAIRKFVIPTVIVAIILVWYHLPISLSYQYAAMDSNGSTVKVDVTGKVYKNIFLDNSKDMVISIDSSKIKVIPLQVKSSQFVKDDNGKEMYYQTDVVDGIIYKLRISDNQSIIEYEEYDNNGYSYSLYKTGRYKE